MESKPRDKLYRIECRTSKKNSESLIDNLSKKQVPLMYTTTQANHLMSA